jgi:hypothetical protein
LSTRGGSMIIQASDLYLSTRGDNDEIKTQTTVAKR